MNTKAETTITERPNKPVQGYVKGCHTALVRAEHDERRTELLALRDVLEGQRVGLVDQIEDIGTALMLLSEPGADVVPIRQAAQ